MGGSSFTANPYVPPSSAISANRRSASDGGQGSDPGGRSGRSRSTSSGRLALSATLTPNASKASSCVPRVPSASATAARS